MGVLIIANETYNLLILIKKNEVIRSGRWLQILVLNAVSVANIFGWVFTMVKLLVMALE